MNTKELSDSVIKDNHDLSRYKIVKSKDKLKVITRLQERSIYKDWTYISHMSF